MMSLRIYWRTRRARCVAELVIAAGLVAPLPVLAKQAETPATGRVTAREAIERQFAAPLPARAPEMRAEEAALILRKYHARIGVMLEPKREIAGDGAGR